MNNIFKLCFFICLLFTSSAIKAQKDKSVNVGITIMESSSLNFINLAGNTALYLQPTAPTEAGNALDFSNATNSDIWLNYSSIVRPGTSKNVMVQITDGEIPNGLTLKVIAGEDVKEGKGKTGNPTGQVVLSNQAKPVLTDLKSCYTGIGVAKGHNLTYSLELSSLDDYNQLTSTTNTISITYTFMENN